MNNTNKAPQNTTWGEFFLFTITIIPIIYLALVWNQLPEQVPLHWNFQGEADSYGPKSYLWLLCLGLNVPIYLLMLFIPKFAAKKESFEQMGKKYFRLRLIMQLLMTTISCAIIFAISGVSEIGIETLLAYCFILFMVLFGNYMGSIRQNHFVGIRTPWTLESEEVWKKTHQLGGRLWILGGFISLFLIFLIPNNWALLIIVGLMIAPMLFAAIYSYVLFRQAK